MQVITRRKKKVNIPLDDLLVYLDAAKGVNGGSANDGDTISIWEDQSGNNNDFIQTSGALQPALKTNGVNGLPSVNFDVASMLENTGLSTSNEVSFWIAYKRNGITHGGYQSIFMLSEGATSFLQIRPLNGNLILDAATPALDGVFQVENTDPVIIGVVKTETQIDLYVNNIKVNTYIGAQNLTGINHYIGGVSGNYFNGYISEFILYNRDLTNLETQQVNDYLTTKYAI